MTKEQHSLLITLALIVRRMLLTKQAFAIDIESLAATEDLRSIDYALEALETADRYARAADESDRMRTQDGSRP
jgi:hypothetical protein